MSRAGVLQPVFDGGRFVGDVAEPTKPARKFERALIGWAHWCPGCKKLHVLHLGDFQFEGVKDRPTIRPAAIWRRNPSCRQPGQQFHCVYTITDAKIYFARECTHDHAGKTVEMMAFRVSQQGLPELPGVFVL